MNNSGQQVIPNPSGRRNPWTDKEGKLRPGVRPNHPHQVRMDVHMSNGVTNAMIVTLHAGDYSFVDRIAIAGVEVGYGEITEEQMKARVRCMLHEVGHRVPADTIRKTDGRLVGSCEVCHERINIFALPGPTEILDAGQLLAQVMFGAEDIMPDLEQTDARLRQQLEATTKALEQIGQAKRILLSRLAGRRP